MSEVRKANIQRRAVVLLAALFVEAVFLVQIITDRLYGGVVTGVIVMAVALLLLANAYRIVMHGAARIATLEEELEVAYTDPVTGVAVRRVAEKSLTDRAGTHLTVALADVDDMHGINSTYTHQGGDWYLAAVAQRLQDGAVDGLVARLGGDKFVLITQLQPHTLASNLRLAFEPPAPIGRTTVPMRVSIGITRAFGGSPHLAFGKADLAMFAAKQHGTGIEIYDVHRDGLPAAAGARPAMRRRDQRQSGRAADA